MSSRSHLSRTARGWLAVSQTATGWDYALAQDADGRLNITREASVPTAAAVRTQADLGDACVATAIGSDEVVCETLQLPTVEAGELKQMLALQIDHLTPLPLEEVVYDFTPLETADGKTRVLVALGRKSAINARVAPLEAAGLPPELVTVDVLALFRALVQNAALPGDDKLNAFMHARTNSADIILFTRGQPVLVRTVLLERAGAGTVAPVDLRGELRRTIFAAQVELPGVEFGKLTLVGPAAADCARDWENPVEVLADGAVPSVAASLCAEAGAAQRLNLLPAEWRQKRRRAKARQTWVRVGIGLAALYLLLLTRVLVATGFRKAQLNRLRADKNKIANAYQDARQLHSELAAMQAQLDDQYSALEILRTVSTLLPENLKLNGFTFRRDDAVTLKGQADTAQSAYSLVERLQSCGLFIEVKFGGGGVRTESGSGLTRFEVTATLKSAAGKLGGAPWR